MISDEGKKLILEYKDMGYAPHCQFVARDKEVRVQVCMVRVCDSYDSGVDRITCMLIEEIPMNDQSVFAGIRLAVDVLSEIG